MVLVSTSELVAISSRVFENSSSLVVFLIFVKLVVITLISFLDILDMDFHSYIPLYSSLLLTKRIFQAGYKNMSHIFAIFLLLCNLLYPFFF